MKFPSDTEPGDRLAAALLDAAELTSAALRAEKLAKRFFAACYLSATGTIAEREAKARTNPEYVKAEDDWLILAHDANIAEAKAEGMRVKFELFRSLNATKRAEMTLR